MHKRDNLTLIDIFYIQDYFRALGYTAIVYDRETPVKIALIRNANAFPLTADTIAKIEDYLSEKCGKPIKIVVEKVIEK